MLPDEEDEELTEEEELVEDQIALHPTRDDWHEQRESAQECEAVVHVRIHVRTIELTTTPALRAR